MPRKLPRRTETNGRRKLLRFGDLIAAVYERCGEASANGLLRLAVNAHLVVFPEGQRFMIVKRHYEGSRKANSVCPFTGGL
jgi:hypothetical protein